MLLQTPAASSYHRVVIGSLNHFLCWNARNQDHTCSAALSEPIYLVIRDQSENGATNPAGGIRRCYRPSTSISHLDPKPTISPAPRFWFRNEPTSWQDQS